MTHRQSFEQKEQPEVERLSTGMTQSLTAVNVRSMKNQSSQ